MPQTSYEPAHIGIGTANRDEAMAVASLFAQIFKLPIKDGLNSVYAGNAVKVMKKTGERLPSIAANVLIAGKKTT